MIITFAKNENNSFYQAQLSVFRGLLQEKKYHNYKLAQLYYQKSLNDIAIFGAYGKNYAAYAYFGLSRISDFYGDKENKKNYRKQALKLADLKKINFD